MKSEYLFNHILTPSTVRRYQHNYLTKKRRFFLLGPWIWRVAYLSNLQTPLVLLSPHSETFHTSITDIPAVRLVKLYVFPEKYTLFDDDYRSMSNLIGLVYQMISIAPSQYYERCCADGQGTGTNLKGFGVTTS